MLFAPRGFIYQVHFCYISLCYSEAALVILLFIGLVITKKDNNSKDVDADFSIRKSFGIENSLNERYESIFNLCKFKWKANY